MKAVIFLGVFLLAAVLAVNESEDDYGFKCTHGVHYQENKCNGCTCSRDGLVGCTRKACPPVDPKVHNCERGTTWEEGCEKCSCISMGTICTTDCGKVHDELLQH